MYKTYTLSFERYKLINTYQWTTFS